MTTQANKRDGIFLPKNQLSNAINIEEATTFINALTPDGIKLSFQSFDDSSAKNAKLAGIKHGSFDECVNWLIEQNQKGAGVFVTINETDGKGRKASNVCRVRAIFADFDSPTPGILEKLRSDALPPSIIVESSEGKFHAYWLVENLPLKQFKSIQQSIANHWGSDPKVCDLPRVMRLPGFLHQKAAPQLVRLVEVTGRRYGQELVERYTPKAVAEAPCSQQGRPDAMTSYAEAALNRACSAVASAIEGSRNDTLNREAFGLAQLIASGDLPEVPTRERLASAAVAAGLAPSEISTTIRSAFAAGAMKPRTSNKPRYQTQNLIEVPLYNLMSATLEPVRFAVKPWMPRRHVTLLGGHGGIGKSSLALTIGAHVACGMSFAGQPVEKLPVLFVSLEDEANIVLLRLRRIIETYKLPATQVVNNLRLLDGTQCLEGLMTESDDPDRIPTFTPAFSELADHAKGAGLIIIDNASDAFDGNENNRRTVRTFVRGLATIARKHDAAVALLAHIDKAAAKGSSNKNNYSGSTAWHNSPRSRLAQLEEAGRILLVHEKANLSSLADPVPLAFVDEVLMPEIGDPADGLTGEEFDCMEIIRAMKAAHEAGINVPSSVTPGAHSAMKALESLPEYARTFKGRQGSQRAARVITTLIRNGNILREPYKNPQRKNRERLTLASLDVS